MEAPAPRSVRNAELAFCWQFRPHRGHGGFVEDEESWTRAHALEPGRTVAPHHGTAISVDQVDEGGGMEGEVFRQTE